MSDSEEISSSDDELFTTTGLRALLKAMRSDIDEALESVQRVLKEAHDTESADAPKQHPLAQPAQEFFQLKQATKEELLKILINQWSQQGRFTVGGSSVRIPETAATLLHLPSNQQINWSLVWKALDRLFVRKVDGRCTEIS